MTQELYNLIAALCLIAIAAVLIIAAISDNVQL